MKTKLKLLPNPKHPTRRLDMVQVLVLAAGRSTRVGDPKTKLLHEVGRTMILRRVLDNLKNAGLLNIRLVVGHQRDLIEAELPEYPKLLQEEQLGTGNAVSMANCVIAADILEHVPFEDLEIALKNLNSYLVPGGRALITIPHRLHYLLFMTSLFGHKPLALRFPTLKRILGRKISIDPDHEWEVGDGRHRIIDAEEKMKKSGFKVEERYKLVYVDFRVLRKP
ncbi:MAG TPA: NTP transferase domain-containing protein [Candidatus Paceibacterota bacterium]|nr:NTP transferase domain-containing protein [Candidatus Paceibacterota bacterium]